MPLSREPHPRFKLKKLAKQLRKLSFPTSPISIELARYATDAIEKFLSGECKSLDAAFGVAPKRGAPGWPKERVKMAREIFKMRCAGKSWHDIERTLKVERVTLRRIYSEFNVRLRSRELVRQLKSEMPHE